MAHIHAAIGGNLNPPIANNPIAIPNQPSTFAELYQQMPDVYNGVYLGLLEQYSGTLAATTSRDLITLSQRFPTTVPNVFLYVDNNGVIKTVHQVHGVEVIIGQPGPWDQSCFAFNSDTVHGQVGRVLLPPITFFRTVSDITVPTIATMEAVLTALPAGTTVCGPYQIADADTDEISVRRAVPVPHAYVHMVLNRSFTPTEAWLQLGTQIIADNREADCAILLNFLRAASTFTRRAVAQRGPFFSSIALAAELMAPVADAALLEHQHRHLTRLLPVLVNPDGQIFLQQQLAQTHYAMQLNLQAQTAAQQATTAATTAAGASKSFTEAYPAMAPSLRKLCDAGDDDTELPEFWKLFAAANGKKQQCFPALETLLALRAEDPASAQVYPILPAKLYESLAQFKIGNPNIDEIQLGLSPFMMCPTGYFKADNQMRTNSIYTMLHGEGGTASISELQTLLASTFNLPTDLLQLLEFVGAYSVTVDVIMGPDTSLAVALKRHYDFLSAKLHTVRSSVPTSDLLMWMMKLLRYIQLIVLTHINSKLNLQAHLVADPNFAPIEQAILFRTYNLFPSIPARYLSEMNAAAGKPTASRTSTLPSSLPSPSGTAPTPKATRRAAAAADTESTRVVAIASEIVQTWVKSFDASPKNIRALRNLPIEQQPTSSDATTKLCLSWHLKGFCYSRCMNCTTHRPLDAAETATFQSFVTSAF